MCGPIHEEAKTQQWPFVSQYIVYELECFSCNWIYFQKKHTHWIETQENWLTYGSKKDGVNHVSIYAQVHKLNPISESELTFVSVFHFTIMNLLDQTTAKGS